MKRQDKPAGSVVFLLVLALAAPGLAKLVGPPSGLASAGQLAAPPVCEAQLLGGEVEEQPAHRTAPRRFLWVIRHALSDTLAFRAMADSAAAAGITDLLVQVRGRGEAYYRSATEPAPLGLETPPPPGVRRGDRPSEQSLPCDPLAAALRIARARGLKVHAWINVFLAGAWDEKRAPHIIVRRPDFIIRLKGGALPNRLSSEQRKRLTLEGIYIDPGNPEVRDYLIGVVEELVRRYEIDGLHYDYIRYPSTDAGYNEVSLSLYEKAKREGSLPADPEGRWSNGWDRWRADCVSMTVAELSATARAIRPGLEISAAVFPHPEDARRDTKQDWQRWLEEGWCDRVLQMAYTQSPDRLNLWRRIVTRQDPRGENIVPGLGLHRLEPKGLKRMLIDLRDEGTTNLAFFSDAEFKKRPVFWRVLRWYDSIPDAE